MKGFLPAFWAADRVPFAKGLLFIEADAAVAALIGVDRHETLLHHWLNRTSHQMTPAIIV